MILLYVVSNSENYNILMPDITYKNVLFDGYLSCAVLRCQGRY